MMTLGLDGTDVELKAVKISRTLIALQNKNKTNKKNKSNAAISIH